MKAPPAHIHPFVPSHAFLSTIGTLPLTPPQFKPSESYNYHPLLPPVDAENPSTDSSEKTCSICMEEVDTRPGPTSEVLLGINPRRAYALAPCHHLFHTKCLAQWLAIKVSCRRCSVSGIC